MSKLANGPEVQTLLEVIASGAPGWGRALLDVRRMSKLSQDQLGTALNVTRSTISNWEREQHRPAPALLRKALITMRVDARIVEQHFPGAIGVGNGLGMNTDPKTLALTLAERMVELAGADADAIEDAIHDTLDAAVLAAQGLKALSDPRSAALFLERGDKRRQRRKREAPPVATPENAVFVRRARGELDGGGDTRAHDAGRPKV
jgi:transcriptional regulator with XRE-family HTH domain